MNDQVKSFGLRLAAALGFPLAPEHFTGEVGWALLARLETAANERRPIDPAALRAIEDLSITLNVRGGDEAGFAAALEAQLGPSPFPTSTIVQVVRYVRSQLHAFSPPAKKLELEGQPREYVPLKNLDYD